MTLTENEKRFVWVLAVIFLIAFGFKVWNERQLTYSQDRGNEIAERQVNVIKDIEQHFRNRGYIFICRRPPKIWQMNWPEWLDKYGDCEKVQ